MKLPGKPRPRDQHPRVGPVSSAREPEGTCPICTGRLGGAVFPYESFWEGVVYTRRRCERCHATVVDPLPDEERLRRTYAWDAYHATVLAHRGVDPARRHARAIRLLQRGFLRTGPILDFGCGAGELLRELAARGWSCEGAELTDTAIAESAARAGVRVSRLEELVDRGARFHVIHMCDVLHHLRDPVRTLRVLEPLLERGGRFLIDGPLEDNPSVVRWASTAAKDLRRRIGRDRMPTRPPTMLFRHDRDAQRQFFTDLLGYREQRFSVYETGWPLLSAGHGIGVRPIVGAAAVLASTLDPRRPRGIGNRFIAVLDPGRA